MTWLSIWILMSILLIPVYKIIISKMIKKSVKLSEPIWEVDE